MALMHSSSDDDFLESSSPILSQAAACKNHKIPAGHILAALKWRNTPVVQKMSETIKVLHSSGLGTVDFHPSADCAVVFISSAELAEGHQFKRRLAGLKSMKDIRRVVVVERTHTLLHHFANLQHFAVLDLELDLIPITENTLHILLVQMVNTEAKLEKNQFFPRAPPDSNQDADHLLAALKNIPKVGDKKIGLLVDRYLSLHRIAMAPLDELNQLLGPSLGQTVWEYFNR